LGGTAPLPTPPKPSEPVLTSLKYISLPGNVSPLFLRSDIIDIQGTAPVNTKKVVVNDYALQGFMPAKRSFSYKARKEFLNLVE